jgi:hypothetical protein
MNTEQKNRIAEICNHFNTEKVIESADAHYKGQQWNIPVVEDLSVDNFVQIINRIFKQVAEGIAGEDYAIYPWEYTHPIHGASNLGTEIQNLNDNVLQKKPFQDYIINIKWLTGYLFAFNLWNKERTTFDITGLDEKRITLLGLLDKIKTEFANLEKLKEENATEKANLIKEKESVVQFHEQKKQELNIVAESVPTVTNQKAEIDTILKSVQQVESEIRATQKNQNDLYEQLKAQKETQEKEFKGSQEKIAEENNKLKALLESADQKVKYFESLEQFISDKQKEIIRLTGLAADGSLGHTFNTRKDDLKTPVNFWKWAMPVMTLVTVAWVVAVFTRFYTALPTSIEWGVVIVNIVKTLPMFILLGFTVNQYTKERNLQEEYAFKAAVAMTITAYSDKITNVKNKEDLIMNSVDKIYCAPKIHPDRSGSIFSFSTKKITEPMKALTDAVKEIKK